MSRSKKKTPIHGVTKCKSEKKDKKMWHAKFRHTEKQRLKTEDLDDFITTHEREVSNDWSFGKDGKSYWSIVDFNNFKKRNPNLKYDLNEYLKLFRK
jgi:hypothetical protein